MGKGRGSPGKGGGIVHFRRSGFGAQEQTRTIGAEGSGRSVTAQGLPDGLGRHAIEGIEPAPRTLGPNQEEAAIGTKERGIDRRIDSKTLAESKEGRK